jgi:hypothetical protein
MRDSLSSATAAPSYSAFTFAPVLSAVIGTGAIGAHLSYCQKSLMAS